MLFFNVRTIPTRLVSCINIDARSDENTVYIPLLISTTLDENIYIERVFDGVFVIRALGKDRGLSCPYFVILINDGSVGNVASRTTDIAELPSPHRSSLMRFEVITATLGHTYTDRPNPILLSVHRRIYSSQRGQSRSILGHIRWGINNMVQRRGVYDGLAACMRSECSDGSSAKHEDQ